jgi:acetyl-CoA acetyltransferase
VGVRELVEKACIAGVGATPQGKLAGYSADDLAIWALREALADAGLEKGEIDTLIVQRSFGGQGEVREVGHRLAIDPALAFNVGYQGEALLTALSLIATGNAQVVAMLYGTNQRTNRNSFANPALHVGGNYQSVYGLASPASTAALNYRRRMHDYGATEAQLGALVVAQSKAAALNPLAVYREPVTLEQYLAAPYLIAPLRLYDFCMISDGGFATIMVSGERAAGLRKRPVWINGIGFQTHFTEIDHPRAMYLPAHELNASRLWASTDFGRQDLDVLYIQDPYTPSTLSMLEGYGFCERGSAQEWIQGGRIELGGELPLNVNGGQNRMTYMIGWQHTYDAVMQLRDEAEERARQVPNCRVALCVLSSGVGQETCSMILRS